LIVGSDILHGVAGNAVLVAAWCRPRLRANASRRELAVGLLRRERQRWNRIVAAGRQRPRHAPEIPIIRGGVHAPISIHQSAYGVV